MLAVALTLDFGGVLTRDQRSHLVEEMARVAALVSASRVVSAHTLRAQTRTSSQFPTTSRARARDSKSPGNWAFGGWELTSEFLF